MTEQKKEELYLELAKESKPGYVTNLMIHIAENLKVEIENIYFRFEDKMSHDSDEFAFGMLLKEFSIFSCNSQF